MYTSDKFCRAHKHTHTFSTIATKKESKTSDEKKTWKKLPSGFLVTRPRSVNQRW